MRGGGFFFWFQSVGRTRFSCGFVSNNRFIFKLFFSFENKTKGKKKKIKNQMNAPKEKEKKQFEDFGNWKMS